MPVETWTSPNGHFKVDSVLPRRGTKTKPGKNGPNAWAWT